LKTPAWIFDLGLFRTISSELFAEGPGGGARWSDGVFEKKNSLIFFCDLELNVTIFWMGGWLGRGALSLETSPMATLYLTKVEDYG